jgi:predicted N-acetyltransferase YhbS
LAVSANEMQHVRIIYEYILAEIMYNRFMAELALSAIQSSHHLRPLDVRRDLLAVADLIEVCFASTMDADGREYLRQLRRAGREANLLNWMPAPFEQPTVPLNGLVWEEEGRLVGNLSLIPFYRMGRRIYLIANVAVHPDFRRRGIGRALTTEALNKVQEHHAAEVWLQVRAENTSAYNLYLSLGFQNQAKRITWQSTPEQVEKSNLASFTESITSLRRSTDWPQQYAWLLSNYPAEVTWNLSLSAHNFKPGFWHDLAHFLGGSSTQHWAARREGKLLGLLTWEPSRTSTDNLWLAAPPETEAAAIQTLLPRVTNRLTAGRPLSLNYPSGRAEDAFRAAGFRAQQILLWMKITFKQ